MHSTQLQVKKIQTEANKLEQENPNISNNPEKISELIDVGLLNDQLVAFYAEIKDDKNRAVKEVQIFHDFSATFRNVEKMPEIMVFFDESNDINLSGVEIESRNTVAKMVGLDESPPFDSNAIYELGGYLGKRLSKGKLDAVELVRSVRDD